MFIENVWLSLPSSIGATCDRCRSDGAGGDQTRRIYKHFAPMALKPLLTLVVNYAHPSMILAMMKMLRKSAPKADLRDGQKLPFCEVINIVAIPRMDSERILSS